MSDGIPSGFKDHFSTNAAGYARFRPDYPPALFEDLSRLCAIPDTAWDCGCGNGQASLALAENFTRVIATDPSANQIANARPHARIDYRVGGAEASGLDDKSADLVLAAQAAHWFDLELFYAEVRRVAKSNAVIALITYGLVEMDAPVNAVLQDIYHGPIGAHWPPERRHVENGYNDFAFPFPRLEIPQHAMRADWDLDTLAGYIGTWSATKLFREKTGHDPIPDARARLAEVWGEPSAQREIRWPLGGLIGRVE